MDIDEINNELLLQENNLKNLIACLKKLSDSINMSQNIENIEKIKKFFYEVKETIDNLKSVITELKQIKKSLYSSMSEEEYGKLSNNCRMNLYDVSKKITELLSNYIESSNYALVEDSFEYISNASSLDCKTNNIEQTNNDKNTIDDTVVETDEIKINKKVLLISEKINKVILPYDEEELKKILKENSKYSNIQDIVDDKYTVPLSQYKNSTLARFKEAYSLMRKKEKASHSESFDLAFELALKGNLNPAIITACNNLAELDSYLDCLDLDELDKFKYFEVKYELAPICK